jgi:transcriptional regulator with XRE-family HTH domain
MMKRVRLAFERISRNLTQAEAARELGISVIYLRKLEGGHSKPGRQTMIKIERYYGVPASELFPDVFSEI